VRGERAEKFCDGYLRADGEPVFACLTNSECDSLEFAGGGCNSGGLDCGTCSIGRKRPCLVTPISATGTESTTAPVLVGTYCVGSTSGSSFNLVHGGLPGPERIRLKTTLSRLD
jgi:hypothetical protein